MACSTRISVTNGASMQTVSASNGSPTEDDWGVSTANKCMCDLPWCQQNFTGRIDGGNAPKSHYPFGGHRISSVPDETLRSWLKKELRTNWTKAQNDHCVANKHGGTTDTPKFVASMRIGRWHFKENMLAGGQPRQACSGKLFLDVA